MKFLRETKYRVAPGVSFTNFALYFDPNKDDEQTELIFHIKKAEASGDEISVTGNDSGEVTAAINETEATEIKELLKKNLAAIGTDGYDVLDVYDINAEGAVKGLYNITIPYASLKNADPMECKVVYYADNSAVPLEMETTYSTDASGKANGIVFTTGHFSTYAVIAETEAEKIFAEQKADADKRIANLELKARSSKSAKGNIKVDLTVTKGSVKALEDLGYTVKYKYYRAQARRRVIRQNMRQRAGCISTQPQRRAQDTIIKQE